MSTENKIIVKTTSGIVAELNPSITYEQDKAITDVYLDEGLNRVQSVNKADRLGIEFVVFSLNGETANIYEKFKKLPLADARVIIKAVKDVLDPKEQTPAITDAEKKI